jgi:dCTP deaminase
VDRLLRNVTLEVDMDRFLEGVLNSDHLRKLHKQKVILSAGNFEAHGSAFDLHLGSKGWILKGSIKQIASLEETVANVCKKYGKAFQLTGAGVSLRRGMVAVVELRERVDFSQHPWLLGEATGKSSIGRLDILTRLLVNGCSEYERVPYKYAGPLYVEIAPISFDIRIYPNSSLNQLRIHCGPRAPMSSLVGRRLLFQADDGSKFSADAQDNGTLSLDISPGTRKKPRLAAFVLREGELAEFDFKEKGKVDARNYFEAVNSKGGALALEVDRFYILRSVERLALPEDIAVTGMAYSENLGELRIHYAGFAHPWFGMGRKDKKIGAPLIFEVRAHSFPIILRHEEVFATIKFYKMAERIPNKDKEGNEYSNQELKLSTYFAPGTDPS